MSQDLGYILQTINNNVVSISNELNTVQGNIKVIYDQANETQKQVIHIDDRLQALIQEFLLFVDADRKTKSLQLAETRLVKIRQEIQTKYSHYNEVRRVSQSIMQTLDSGTLNEKVLSDVTDELMLKTPKYWLAAVAVALSAWVNDNKQLAETALEEAFKRDDYKTSMFFTLICNRLNRPEATLQWINRYFQHQDPSNLDREFVVILNAIAGGVFPTQCASIAVNSVNSWLNMIGNEKEVADTIRERWVARFSEMTGPSYDKKFPHMKKYVSNYDNFDNYLALTSTFEEHVKFVKTVFTTNISKKSLVDKVDDLILNLTTSFDDEELPLHKEERKYSLIIEENGDEGKAERKFKVENEVFEEKVDILQILTNTAMNPKQSSVDILTQRLSITLSKPYILSAHALFTNKVRGLRPPEAIIKVDLFQGASTNGKNETDLLNKFEANMKLTKEKAIQNVKLTGKDWTILVGALISAYMGFIGGISFMSLASIGLGIWFVVNLLGLKKIKENIEQDFNKRIISGKQIIKALCAELVDYLQLIESCDPNAEKFQKDLNSYIPENVITSETRKISA